MFGGSVKDDFIRIRQGNLLMDASRLRICLALQWLFRSIFLEFSEKLPIGIDKGYAAQNSNYKLWVV